MRSRFARYVGAQCAIVAMLCGQFALAAYACAAPTPSMPITMAHAAMGAKAGHVPCAAMLASTHTPQANACEVHCNDGVTSPGEPDWPPVTLAPLPVPNLALARLATADGVAQMPPVPLPGAPPPAILFCRLLI